MHVYIGSRTTRERNARGDGISVFDYAPDTGSLTLTQVVGGLINPSYLLAHPTLPVLYTVHGDSGEVSALHRDTRDGALKPWRMQACEGRNPVHLALGPAARYLMVSNHLTGALAVLPVAPDGSLAPVSQTVALAGEPGPHRKEQPHAKPHYNLVDPSGRYVVVPDKGLDRVFLYGLDVDGVSAEPACVAATREGAGPRHAVFHPSGRWLYVVNELDNTVAAYTLEAGALRPFQVLTTLPDTYTGNSRAAGIAMARHGLHLYASNRGDDSIAVFRVDPASGWLAPLQHVHTHGKTPRFCTLSPDGRFLFALNEDSDTLQRFHVNPADGTLVRDGYELRVGSPVCMVFARRQA
ncbi:lactonase family protein [Achromobacter sp. NFACC18-2]|uniref:lactonase family protein n=1 Tax=Achromobacter sp. NFACC18-2 TaxID=1564112 RepID=UPI0008ADD70D|nr:lactonase family protein [Achromobacter sp. NFACC18-2]SEJ74086.1 6-phosphogluconolactonase, cycloisomerase 2 family [Achromobacter sp. NFACC18-2]